MNFIHRFSLPALMLTTLAASAMSIAVAPQSADASFSNRFHIRRQDADVYINKFDRKHYVRGKCFIAKGKIFAPPLPISLRLFPSSGTPGGAIRCSADVFRGRAARIRLRRTRKLHVKRYAVVARDERLKVVTFKQSKTCHGKRCVVKITPSPNPPRPIETVGMTACIESRGKSRIVQIGNVPKGLDNGFKSKRCSQRKF
ncbi:hypothetical protein IQ266_08495 [filamentous cyanobacterium LEGE 11480]|uniref:Uncharacterized protein n=1 Tax=Romeriopsis navalis LEGE 11480 TaxID=2777977 RepID=A0A928Z2P7_9CYAN|nr:hypothetical protein [Romeriopsis navalis]MBE9029764.1 hypothetical protein [Romeriopsis navalis LEGE 11480]